MKRNRKASSGWICACNMTFWDRPFRNWRFWIIPACLLIELPFLVLMDGPGSPNFRRIHGVNGLHVLLADLTELSPLSHFIGWVFDFDKSFAYLVTAAGFVWMSRTLRQYESWRIKACSASAVICDKTDHRGTLYLLPYLPKVRWPRAVLASGILGAILISLHYITSSSEHYIQGPHDRGLFSAMHHLRNGWSLNWAALAGYRIGYLMLAPVVYFILFSTTTMAVVMIGRMTRMLPELTKKPSEAVADQTADMGRKVLRSFMAIAILPAGLLFMLHHVISWRFELKQYGAGPETVRFWILLFLYVEALIVLFIGGFFHFVTSWTSTVTEFRSSPIHLALSWLFFLLMFLAPTASPLLNLRASEFNTSLAYVAECSDDDPSLPPERSRQAETVLANFARDPWRSEAACSPKIVPEGLDNLNYRAVIVLIGGLIIAGQDDDAIAQAMCSGPECGRGQSTAATDLADRMYKLLKQILNEHQWVRNSLWTPTEDCPEYDSMRGMIGNVRRLTRPK